jgi:hypothetical protein
MFIHSKENARRFLPTVHTLLFGWAFRGSFFPWMVPVRKTVELAIRMAVSGD